MLQSIKDRSAHANLSGKN